MQRIQKMISLVLSGLCGTVQLAVAAGFLPAQEILGQETVPEQEELTDGI